MEAVITTARPGGTGAPASRAAASRVFALLTCAAALISVPPAAVGSWSAAPGAAERTLVLALLYGGCAHAERLRRALGRLRPMWRNESAEVGGGGPEAADAAGPAWGPCVPVLLAGVLLLPAAAAALVPVPGTLLDPVPRRSGALRRGWNAAQLSLAAAAAGAVFRAAGGPAMLSAVLPGRARGGPVAVPELLLPAMAAALAFTVLNRALVAVVRRLDGEPRTSGGRPARMAGASASACAHGLFGLLIAVLWLGPYGVFAAVLVLLPLGVSAWVCAQSDRERAAHRATVRALVQAVEIKDEYTRGHSERVGRAAVLVAGRLGMDGPRTALLRTAGTLHDVGKLGVPTRVLRKNGPLTSEERGAVELHPEYGHEMVRGISFLGEARAGILHHHERYDGRGYPAGLAGDAIPQFARIIAVADAFDSMTSTRSYRRGRPVAEAVAELERCAGTQFDPVMVRALVDAVRTHGWQPARPPAGADAVPDIPLGLPEPAGKRAADAPAAAPPGPRPPAADRAPAGRVPR